jgi:glycosyltransferase involved in cell wall biosynthesis
MEIDSMKIGKESLNMSKVSIFLTDLSGGGAERVMLNLANGFVRQGHQVELILVNLDGPYLDQLSPAVKVINLNSGRLFKSILALTRHLRLSQPDVLFSALEDTNLVALWAAKIAGISTRLVVTVHNHLSNESKYATSFKRRFIPRLIPWFYPWANAVVAVSQGVADDLANLGLSKHQIKVIYNPVVTPDLFERSIAPVNHSWFQSGDYPIVLGVGRLTPQKDFHTLIKAFAQVRKQRSLKLVILGEGQERRSLEALVEQLDLTEDVDLVGFVDNPYAYMSKASICVLSSAWEGFGNVLVESMAVGVPVVSTNCKSGPAEILDNGSYGSLVEVGDVNALASAILQTLESPTQADTLKHRASQFSLDKALNSYALFLHQSNWGVQSI